MRFMNNNSRNKLDICFTGYQSWYKKAVIHRLNGPAYISPDGHREWFQNDLLHRLDGPAIIWSDGYEEWYENDIRLK